jgi:hypothetical protein
MSVAEFTVQDYAQRMERATEQAGPRTYPSRTFPAIALDTSVGNPCSPGVGGRGLEPRTSCL